MSNPKRHHFVPESYLELFANNSGKLYVFPKNKDRESFATCKSNVAVRSQYYTFINDEGKRDYKIEKTFADLEGHAKPILGSIIERNDISYDDKFTLSLYIGLMASRNPNYRRGVEKFLKHTVDIVKNRVFETNDDLIQSAPDAIVKLAGGKEKIREWARENIDVEITKEASLQFVHFGVEIAWHLLRMRWRFLINTERTLPFITSDNPSYVCSSNSGETLYGIGIGLRSAQLYFPVSPQICLVGDWNAGSLEYRSITKKKIIRINSRTIRYADKEVYSSVSSERIKQLVINNRKYEFSTLIDQVGPYHAVRRKLVKTIVSG